MDMLTVCVSETYEARSGDMIEAGTVLKSATEREVRRNQALLRKGLAEPVCDVAKSFLADWMRRRAESNARDGAIRKRAESAWINRSQRGARR